MKENYMITYVGELFLRSIFYSIGVYVSMSVLHCFDYCMFVEKIEIRSVRASILLLFSRLFLFGGSLESPYES